MSNTATHYARVASASRFANSAAGDTDHYYAYLSDPRSGAAPAVVDDVSQDDISPSRLMIAAKLAYANDVCQSIRNIPWVQDTIYDRYDDTADLANLDFYAIVNAGAYSHVWKCIDNGNGAPSTQRPVLADVDGADELYEPADGYRWKYMYTSNSSVVSKFASLEWFPLGSNTSVSDLAVQGAIDLIAVVDGGQGYANYLTGTFSSADAQVGNTTTYSVGSNTSSSAVGGFYTGCVLYISAGTGAGQNRRIVDYFANASGRYVALASPFITAPVNGSGWEIYPEVLVSGDGQTVNAVARALINSAAGNSVARVEMLSRGAGYRQHTANVVANSAVSIVRAADLRSVYGPPGGHGKCPHEELLATATTITVSFANSESNTIPTASTFRQVGLMSNPLFDGVTVGTANATGTFLTNETVVRVPLLRILANAASTDGSSNVVTTATANTLFVAGDVVYLASSDDREHQLITIVSANTTALVANAASLWACSSVIVSLATVSNVGMVLTVPDGNHVILDRCKPTLANGDLIVGISSGVQATVNSLSRSGLTKSFVTFVGCDRLDTGPFTGTFIVGEALATLDGTATGIVVQAIETSGVGAVHVANTVGSFQAPHEIVGQTSGATAIVTAAWDPEISPGSGRAIYVENVDAVQRSNTTTEKLLFTIQF